METAVFAAGAADVVHVVAGGRVVATRGQHREIGRELETAVTDHGGDQRLSATEAHAGRDHAVLLVGAEL